MILSIENGGVITAIYNDDLEPLMAQAKICAIERASHVEPTSDAKWAATMTDGTVLGPYTLRSEALAAEVAYLESKLFGAKGRDCTCGIGDSVNDHTQSVTLHDLDENSGMERHFRLWAGSALCGQEKGAL